MGLISKDAWDEEVALAKARGDAREAFKAGMLLGSQREREACAALVEHVMAEGTDFDEIPEMIRARGAS